MDETMASELDEMAEELEKMAAEAEAGGNPLLAKMFGGGVMKPWAAAESRIHNIQNSTTLCALHSDKHE